MGRPPLFSVLLHLSQELQREDPILRQWFETCAGTETIPREDPELGHDLQRQGGGRNNLIRTDGGLDTAVDVGSRVTRSSLSDPESDDEPATTFWQSGDFAAKG